MYGLDRPLLVQFGDYLWHIVRYGDFGYSFRSAGPPGLRLCLAGALPVTFTIGLLALALATGVGVPIGVLAAARQNRAADRISMVAMLMLYSVPSFVLIPLILAVDIWLEQRNYPSLPVANWGTVQQAILPILVLAAGNIAYIARLTRTTMVGMLREDFIRTARAKGLPRAADRGPARPAPGAAAGGHLPGSGDRRRWSPAPSWWRTSSTCRASASPR